MLVFDCFPGDSWRVTFTWEVGLGAQDDITFRLTTFYIQVRKVSIVAVSNVSRQQLTR